MSITVQVHPDRFSAVLFDGQPDPFVVVRANEDGAGVSLFLSSAALFDELIKTAVEGKRLLLAAQQPAGDASAVEVRDGGTSDE